MDKYLRPSRFDCDPNVSGADKGWKDWFRTFENLLSSIDDLNKLMILTDYVAPKVYEFTAYCTNYEESVQIL